MEQALTIVAFVFGALGVFVDPRFAGGGVAILAFLRF